MTVPVESSRPGTTWCGACATTSGTRPSMRRLRPPTGRPGCIPCTGRPTSQRRAGLPLGGDHRRHQGPDRGPPPPRRHGLAAAGGVAQRSATQHRAGHRHRPSTRHRRRDHRPRTQLRPGKPTPGGPALPTEEAARIMTTGVPTDDTAILTDLGHTHRQPVRRTKWPARPARRRCRGRRRTTVRRPPS